MKIDLLAIGLGRISWAFLRALRFSSSYHLHHHLAVFLCGLFLSIWTCFDEFSLHPLGITSILKWAGGGKIWPLHRCWAALSLVALCHLAWILYSGGRESGRLNRVRRALLAAGIKNAEGEVPTLLKVARGNPPAEVLLRSNGVSPEDITVKAKQLESALHARFYAAQYLESESGKIDRSVTQIIFSTVDLPIRFTFKDVKKHLKEAYTFPIGTSYKGIVVDSLESHTHILACGTTGGGKSNFLNTFLLSMLSSSEPVDLTLIDLKGGIEFETYRGIKGSKVYSTVDETLDALSWVQAEMEIRFAQMKALGLKKFNRAQMKKNRMVVVIDEASILYTLSSSDRRAREKAIKAREVSEHLVKTARASGIHILFAAQKPDKKSLDTSIRTNIGAVMTFRLPDVPSSVIAVGNRAACDLPQISGRGLWKHGNEMIEVQTAYLSDQELEATLNELKRAPTASGSSSEKGAKPANKITSIIEDQRRKGETKPPESDSPSA